MDSTESAELDALIAAYLQACERGERPDRQQWLAQYPQHAEPLAKFFADLELLPTSAWNDAARAQRPRVAHEPQPGHLIAGRYKLLENIGEGGMGSVWVAEQQPIKRKVAIKLIKPGMDSKQVLARFEAERQALALMDHPHIAKVFDGGMTEQGRPYFVMEYVKGVPLTSYCDTARLSLTDRLKLFMPVCHAVQHAHQKGIVHRDLKPSNILVCLYDGEPVPKVIDFGLAKALHQRLTEHTLFTGHGVMVGTPLYMSPEQAEMNNLDVDTRTDIYSLGVVLYELLTGTTPLEREQLQTAAYQEVLRLIKEVEPPRPSLRLSSLASLPTIAAQRNIDPQKLRRSVTGDLDWIVMRALEKERNRRYETANGLARDIERFLNEDAVEACPPSTWYRLRKFASKHRRQTIVASVIGTSLVGGIISTSWGLVRARRAEQAAERSEARAVDALRHVTQERDAKIAEQRKTAEALVAEARQREMAERQLCLGILRPIGYAGYRSDLSDAELRALSDWSALPDDRMKLKVLDIALSDAEIAARIGERRDWAMQACVGMSPRRRAQALAMLTDRQRDPALAPRIRASACCLALALGSNELPALRDAIDELPDAIALYAARLNQANVAIAWSALLAMVEKPDHADALDVLPFASEGLAALAPRLAEDQVPRVLAALLAIMEKSNDSGTLAAAGNGLAALIPRLDSDQVPRVLAALLAIVEKSNEWFALEAAGKGLAALAPRLAEDQVPRVLAALLAIIEKSNDSGTLLGYSGPLLAARNGLAALAPRLAGDEVLSAWSGLLAVVGVSESNFFDAGAANNGLAALAPRLAEDQVPRVLAALLARVQKTDNLLALLGAGWGLVALAPRLDGDQAFSAWSSLLKIESKLTFIREEIPGVLDLAALAPRLEGDEVLNACSGFLAIVEKPDDRDALWVALSGLSALASRLDADQVSSAWSALLAIVEKSDDQVARLAAGNGLAALASRLDADQVPGAWSALLAIVEESDGGGTLAAAGKGLAALTPRLDADQTLSAWSGLLAILEEPENFWTFVHAANGLVALAPRLGRSEIIQANDAIVFNLSIENNVLWMEATNETDESHGDDHDEYFEYIAILTPQSIAKLLTHPFAVGESQEVLLQRFEELVLYDGQSVFLRLKSSVGAPIERAAVSARSENSENTPSQPAGNQSDGQSPLKRQFRTVHDAAAWIEKNWPDFDLDATLAVGQLNRKESH